MKTIKLLFFTLLLVVTNVSFAQVGIGTTDPSADLDVNGNARIRSIPTGVGEDEILTVDAAGNIRKVNSESTAQVLVLQKSTNQFITTANTIQRVTFDAAPVIDNGADISWNGTNAFTCNATGA